VSAYFFDSSALVKRYASEVGTGWVKSIAEDNNNSIYIAQITIVEVIAAIERRKRRNPPEITAADASAAARSFRADALTRYLKVNISNSLIEDATNVAEKHGLRAYDAVQLAAALTLQQLRLANKMQGLILISADTDLNSAAAAEGLTVDNPNTH
jgi:uncharacterized protein